MMNKLHFKQLLFTATFAVLALTACRKDRLPPIAPQPSATTGIYVLCEGAFTETAGVNNSSITYFDLSTSIPEKDYFKRQNGVELGTNANDLKQYGSKMYCVITGTKAANKDSYLEVMNIATGKSLKRIPFSDGTAGFLPRYIAFHKGKAYISGFDGYISKVDTASLSIEARLKVGGAMEQLDIVNNKLYVTNSAHFQFGTDNNSSVSVVDLNTFAKVKDITVNVNPIKIAAMANGELFVVTKGNYGDILPTVDKLNSVTDTKTQSTAINLFALNITQGKGYGIVEGAWPAPNTLKVFNVATGAVGSDFVTDQTPLVTPYAVTVNNLDNNVFVADANDYGTEGKMFCFSADGKKRFVFATGGMPQSIVFKYSYK